MYFPLNDIWLKKKHLSLFETKDVYEIMEEISSFY